MNDATKSDRREDSVISYLRRHPDFFDRHPALLAEMAISGGQRGQSVSLIERQVAVLRERQHEWQKQFRHLVANVKDQERLQDQMHRVALGVAGMSSLDEMLDELPPLLRELFSLERVALRIGMKPRIDYARPELVRATDKAYEQLAERVRQHSFTGEEGLPAGALDFLFGAERERVASCALVPLGRRAAQGVLALGAASRERFSTEQGTVYLDRMGEIIGAALKRMLV
jgi:uncharacterized protein YigA (DUF484 family)